jgi:putative endonuclease
MNKVGNEFGNELATEIWWLYLLLCSDGRTYVGIAKDVQARFDVHVSGRGARFTRANRPVKVLGAQHFINRSEASKAEYVLKQLSREERLAWALKFVWPSPA